MVEELLVNQHAVIKSFEDLKCWKACRDVRLECAQLVTRFPQHEKFQLISQITRAARSSTNNIAEGYGRFHYQENIQFCRQARGSLYELLDHMIVALDENYITSDELERWKERLTEAAKILNGYIRYLGRAKEQETNNNSQINN